ncbi:MAG: hypothetical protein M1828_006548 [Chrysothrix sp. TS-e1954]|nr:MAG: hypothetical protein M1828_006548 [Chrysothrix sp. TS-e1954]
MVPFLSRLSPIPCFPSYTGPYTVGTVDVEIPVTNLNEQSVGNSNSTQPYEPLTSPDSSLTTIAYRLYYPCSSPAAKPSSKPAYWISNPQHETLAGYARFLGASASLSQFFSYLPQQLYHVKIPAVKDAPLLPTASGNKWPLLIFSHGLGGSRQAYSHLCGSLASQGMIVAAADHRDGSKPNAFITNPEDPKQTREIHYRSLPHSASPETFRGRDAQLSIRFWELTCLLESIKLLDSGNSITNLLQTSSSQNPLSSFASSINLAPSSIALSGHSFGASTALAFYKRAFYSDAFSPQGASLGGTLWTPPPSSAAARLLSTPQTPLFLLDLWALPLDSPDNSALHSAPLPWYHSPPSIQQPPTSAEHRASTTLAILSSAFHNWTSNFRSVCRHLSPPRASGPLDKPFLFYPQRSAHLSQSDFGLLFPRLTKWLAKAEEPARILELNVRAITEVLRRRQVLPESEAGAEFGDGDEADEEDGFTLVDAKEEAKGDWRILDTSVVERVRGWMYVDVEAGAEGRESHAARETGGRDVTAESEPALGGEELAERR